MVAIHHQTWHFARGKTGSLLLHWQRYKSMTMVWRSSVVIYHFAKSSAKINTWPGYLTQTDLTLSKYLLSSNWNATDKNASCIFVLLTIYTKASVNHEYKHKWTVNTPQTRWNKTPHYRNGVLKAFCILPFYNMVLQHIRAALLINAIARVKYGDMIELQERISLFHYSTAFSAFALSSHRWSIELKRDSEPHFGAIGVWQAAEHYWFRVSTKWETLRTANNSIQMKTLQSCKAIYTQALVFPWRSQVTNMSR